MSASYYSLLGTTHLQRTLSDSPRVEFRYSRISLKFDLKFDLKVRFIVKVSNRDEIIKFIAILAVKVDRVISQDLSLTEFAG